MKEFMLLLSGELDFDESVSIEEKQKEMEKYLHWLNELKEKGLIKGGQPLKSSGKVINKKDGIVVDGPFTETKETIGGYFIILANDLEEATEIAKTCPHVLQGGTIEIRELGEI